MIPWRLIFDWFLFAVVIFFVYLACRYVLFNKESIEEPEEGNGEAVDYINKEVEEKDEQSKR